MQTKRSRPASCSRVRGSEWRKRTFSVMPACALAGPLRSDDFVAQHRPQPCFLDRVGDLVQRTVDGVGAGVVVDQRRRAVLDGIHQADQRAVAHVHIEQRPIQPPPQPFQDVGEILGGRAGNGHAARKGAVEVGVGADVAGHDQLAAGVQLLRGRIAPDEVIARADGADNPVADQQRAVEEDLVGIAPGDQTAVVDQQIRCDSQQIRTYLDSSRTHPRCKRDSVET